MTYKTVAIIILSIIFILFFYTFYLINRIIKHKNIKIKYHKTTISIITLFILLSLIYLRNISFIIFIYIILFSITVDIIYFMSTKMSFNFNKKFQIYLVIPILISNFLTLYGYYNTKNIIKTEYNIVSNKNISKNYKIGLVSDIHFGKTINIETLEKYISKINDENLDFFVLAGDIVDENTNTADYQKIFNVISSVKTKYGIYFINGNHDENYRLNKTNELLLRAIEENNIIFLNEKSTKINNDLILTGRLDYIYKNTGKRLLANELSKNLDKSKYMIVTDHQPYYYEENKNAEYDLQLSGHTHAGQIWPLGFVTNFLGFDYGLLEENNFKLIVSSGFGTWNFPVRTEKHSEYVIINLKKG